ncbi:MAG: alanine racemase [Desulfobacteraceae bacterium]|nr:MAG: alanine racemase [Desulfobacteraceae bacterium]
MAILKANTDSSDLSSAKLQLEHFSEVLKFYEDRGLAMPVCHIANSYAVLQLPASCLDIVRPGILMYSVYPANDVLRNFLLCAKIVPGCEKSVTAVPVPIITIHLLKLLVTI